MDNEDKTETLTKQQEAMYDELIKRGVTFKGYTDCDNAVPKFHIKPVERTKYRPHKGLKELKKMEKRKNATT